MAATAGKKESVSVSFFREVKGLEVEEDLSSTATLLWDGRRVDGQMEKGSAEGAEEADFWSTEMETGERTCRSRRVRDP